MKSNVFGVYVGDSTEDIDFKSVSGRTDNGLEELYNCIRKLGSREAINQIKSCYYWDNIIGRKIKSKTVWARDISTTDYSKNDRLYLINPDSTCIDIDVYILEREDNIIDSPYLKATEWRDGVRFRKVYQIIEDKETTPDFEAIEQYLEDIYNLNSTEVELGLAPTFNYKIQFNSSSDPESIKTMLESVGMSKVDIEYIRIADDINICDLPY